MPEAGLISNSMRPGSRGAAEVGSPVSNPVRESCVCAFWVWTVVWLGAKRRRRDPAGAPRRRASPSPGRCWAPAESAVQVETAASYWREARAVSLDRVAAPLAPPSACARGLGRWTRRGGAGVGVAGRRSGVGVGPEWASGAEWAWVQPSGRRGATVAGSPRDGEAVATAQESAWEARSRVGRSPATVVGGVDGVGGRAARRRRPPRPARDYENAHEARCRQPWRTPGARRGWVRRVRGPLRREGPGAGRGAPPERWAHVATGRRADR